MTENKRYFSIDYDEKWYIFDSNKISKEEVLEKAEYNYNIFAESLMEDDIVNLLNENEQLKKSIKRQQSSNEECSKYIEEVVKENEQLKSTNMEMEDYLGRVEERIKELKKENQELSLIIENHRGIYND